VTSGDDVVAVVKFTNASYGRPIATDPHGTVETGRTYMSHWGSSWSNMGAIHSTDVAIRLRTSHVLPVNIKLTAQDDAAAGDQFGRSVDIWGGTIVVGAPYKDDSTGAAYVFQRSGTAWSQPFRLPVSGIEPGDNFGISVAISRDTVVVGASEDNGRGTAYIFQRNQGGPNNWGQVKKLTINDAVGPYDQFSVAIIGNTVVVGAYGDDAKGDNAGAAYIFQRNQDGPDNWGQVKKLTADDAASGDWFGWSVATNGLSVVVGAPRDNGHKGSTYIFQRSGTSWSLQEKLTDVSGEGDALFGFSAAISGDTAVVGAHCDGDGGFEAGSAHIYQRRGTSWDLKGKKKGEEEGDQFGFSVSISWDTAIVGAPFHDHAGSDSGIAYSFQQNEGGTGKWGEVAGLIASDAADGDRFGWSANISGDTAVIGAPFDDGGRGSAYVYEPSIGPPTAVTLISFTAEAAADHVILAWETASEPENEGFNVWRSEAADGEYTKLNAALIPAQGNADTGASYAYTDTTMVKGVTYYYQLEDVDIHGVSTFHGPVSAAPSQIRRVYLPLIFKW
jgi:hypothetical protein